MFLCLLCSNRTFMELKQRDLIWSSTQAYRSNRTFMELKLRGKDYASTDHVF